MQSARIAKAWILNKFGDIDHNNKNKKKAALEKYEQAIQLNSPEKYSIL